MEDGYFNERKVQYAPHPQYRYPSLSSSPSQVVIIWEVVQCAEVTVEQVYFVCIHGSIQKDRQPESSVPDPRVFGPPGSGSIS
jgi:hypothetical protein